MSKFITIHDLRYETECPINISIFQKAGLDKVDFSNVESLIIPQAYWETFIWLIKKFKLTIWVLRLNEDEKFKYENGNKVRVEDNAYWINYEYDKNGNEISSKDCNGHCDKHVYDENGNLIRYEDSYGYISQWVYDQSGSCVKHEDSSGLREEWIYYDSGNLMRYVKLSENVYYEDYKYNKLGNLTYKKDSTGNWERFFYDENGFKLEHEKSNGLFEKWHKDIFGKIIKVIIRFEKHREDRWINDLKASIIFKV